MVRKNSLTRLSDVLDDMASGFDFFDFSPFSRSYTVRGQFVDTDRYDIVPKSSYYDTLIKEKQDQIDVVEERLKNLKEEKETLLKSRDDKTKNKDG